MFICFFACTAFPGFTQTLNLPPRAINAPTGSQWTNIVWALSQDERENWIYAQIISGNIPNWQRTLKPISTSTAGHTATYYVCPDEMAIGSDTDYFLEPTTPILAQRLADLIGCTLPTRLMVNEIWTNATVKLTPQTIPPSSLMTTMPDFATNNSMVMTIRDAVTNTQPPGALVSGDKKNVIISTLIYSNLQNGVTLPVVIYGWIYPDGTVIQPAYNGHADTYADYSHGIRFVQMNCTVDGSPNTVTNVLTSSALASLFSDETAAANNTIPTPRYPVAALAPTVMTHPRNCSVLPGTNVSLDALAIGDAPLNYRWLFNGNAVSGATNSIFNLTNVSGANAGNYSVIVTNFSGAATSRVAVLRIKTTDFPILFSDNFETNSATNWNVLWGAANGVPDYTAAFAYDYGSTPYTFNGVTALIPPAPNSADGSTHGVLLTVNDNDNIATNAAVNLYPKNFFVSNNFALKFDMWINYPGNALGAGASGTTQFAQFGVDFSGTNLNWAATTASPSDGLWFALDGDGGAAADDRAYVGNPSGAPTDLTGSPALSGLLATNHTATVFQNLFPAGQFETAGTPGKSWAEVEVRQTNNVVVWLMNGTVVAQRANTSVFTNGTVMLGLMDVFPSIASPARDCFTIFDNVRVENLSPPITFQNIARHPDGSVSLTLNSAFGDNFVLQSSTNLSNWQTVANLTLTNNPLNFTDSGAGGTGTLFYRARR
ncbi:MAG TPA: immunoglobulin domain-containing protein [Candidatus Sulfotelmatobacter sp.]|nr:immunoglobulin domain-containing protein [Candidatus Sulfotelmatobacter sp.]